MPRRKQTECLRGKTLPEHHAALRCLWSFHSIQSRAGTPNLSSMASAKMALGASFPFTHREALAWEAFTSLASAVGVLTPCSFMALPRASVGFLIVGR